MFQQHEQFLFNAFDCWQVYDNGQLATSKNSSNQIHSDVERDGDEVVEADDEGEEGVEVGGRDHGVGLQRDVGVVFLHEIEDARDVVEVVPLDARDVVHPATHGAGDRGNNEHEKPVDPQNIAFGRIFSIQFFGRKFAIFVAKFLFWRRIWTNLQNFGKWQNL